MRILIAEDDMVPRKLLETMLKNKGYEVSVANDGMQAWEALSKEHPPQLAILDWMMPQMDGIDVCRKIREAHFDHYCYIILLTSKNRKEDITAGLDAGADDYIVKPFDSSELLARVSVGRRMVTLQNDLAEHVKRLEEALSKVEQLEGLLPICAYCKKVRGDEDYWQQVEGYLTSRSKLQFSHGICPDCYQTIVKKELEGI